MKKVLILFADLFAVGGLQQYNRNFSDALESEFAAAEFTMLSFYDSPENELKRWRNIKTYLCGSSRPKAFKKIGCIFGAILTYFKEKPGFLICGHVNLAPLGLFLKKAFSIKYAVLTQGIDVWNIKKGIRYYGLKEADLILTVSRYTKDRMLANGISAKKIKFLLHSVNITLFCRKSPDKTLLHKLSLQNKRILLTVSRINSRGRHKGHDTMLEVLREMGDEYVWLVIGGGDDLPRLRQKARSLNISQQTRFLGEIANEKLVDYYCLSDVFIMLSKGEGFGRVFLEAMACGRPVIAGDADGSREPLMDGKLGFLVNPDDREEIKNTIKLVFAGFGERTDSEYLRREVEINFGKEVFNKRVKEIFSEEFR